MTLMGILCDDASWVSQLACPIQHLFFIFFVFFGLFVFLGLHPWHMKVPGLGVQSEL